MQLNPLLLVYLLPLLVIWLIWTLLARRSSRRHLAVLKDNIQAGLDQLYRCIR